MILLFGIFEGRQTMDYSFLTRQLKELFVSYIWKKPLYFAEIVLLTSHSKATIEILETEFVILKFGQAKRTPELTAPSSNNHIMPMGELSAFTVTIRSVSFINVIIITIRGLLMTNLVILNLAQVTRTTFELALPFLNVIPRQRVQLIHDRFTNVNFLYTLDFSVASGLRPRVRNHNH
ncbi:hypothetical protein TNCV_4776401 [Trichonephila clavipes]|nr:hypothetical protein TNCV_4776401 [Trichonephila clavipes]